MNGLEAQFRIDTSFTVRKFYISRWSGTIYINYVSEIQADTSRQVLLSFASRTVVCECWFAETALSRMPADNPKSLEELLREDTRLRAFNNTVPAGIMVLGIDAGNVVFSNRFFNETLGFGGDKVLGGSWEEFFVDPDDRQNMMIAFAEDGEVRNFELPLRRHDGEIVWGLASMSTISVQDEDLLLFAFIDVTPVKQAEQALAEAAARAEAAERAKSQFLATMSHEIRTPMSGVLGFVDMLLEDDLPEASREKVYRIKDATRSLLRIINDVLDMSKLEAGKMEIESIDFDLPTLLRDVMALFREKRSGERRSGVNLDLALHDSLPVGVRTDPTRLRQILVNLIGNALKFTEKGSVVVEAGLEKTAAGDRLRFVVRDTGIGMAPDVIGKLFQEFTQADETITRRFEGTGLGLAICRRLTEAMDGEIGVESEPGKGSTFWFTLPYLPAATSFAAKSAPAAPAVAYFRARRPINILVAEDNPLNQRVVLALLESFGHIATTVGNGLEAVAAHAKGKYDMILMDVRMPKMSGIEATREIRAMAGEKGAIPIVALTADALSQHGEACLAAGMNACVTKPIDRALLATTINDVMGEEINMRVAAPQAVAKVQPCAPEKVAEDEKAAEAAVADFVARIAELTDKS